MKRIGSRSLTSAFAAYSIAALVGLGLAGCGQDNEQAANITGVANPQVGSGSSSYEEYNKKMMEQQRQQYGSQGYPGAQ